jgi:hypothetical protein
MIRFWQLDKNAMYSCDAGTYLIIILDNQWQSAAEAAGTEAGTGSTKLSYKFASRLLQFRIEGLFF